MRYIDADLLMQEDFSQMWNDVADQPIFEHIIEQTPTADVMEVKHGEWFLLDECSNEGVYCSECHKKVYRKEYANQKAKSKFCPNCGAKMDGKERTI